MKAGSPSMVRPAKPSGSAGAVPEDGAFEKVHVFRTVNIRIASAVLN
jgi:hypothetical protein